MATSTMTRQINNVGQPILGPNGKPLVGIVLRFTLVDELYHPVSAFDIETKQKIVGETRVKTNAKGEFAVNLWPNTRGDKKTLYLVHSDTASVERFASVLVEGVDPISLFDFRYLYKDYPISDYNLLSDKIVELIQKSIVNGEHIVIDPTVYSIDISKDMIPGTLMLHFNGLELTEGEDNDFTVSNGVIQINNEHILTCDDRFTFRYNIKVIL